MMLTHQWVAHAIAKSDLSAFVIDAVKEAIQFDCGSVADLPKSASIPVANARPPYPKALLQFEMPHNTSATHLLVAWEEHNESVSHITIAMRHRTTNEWRTALPVLVQRTESGYEFIGPTKEENKPAIQIAINWSQLFFRLAACSNVVMRENAAPDRLNKKRIASGKLPIYSYKTLELNIPNVRATTCRTGIDTHASPRIHLRRGHIRRVSKKRQVWVHPCVVGSKHGIVDKTYSVKRKGGPTP